MLDRIDVEIGLSGALTAEQRAKLMEIAAKAVNVYMKKWTVSLKNTPHELV